MRERAVASIKPSAVTRNGGVATIVAPCRVSHGGGRAEPVVHESVDVGVGKATVGHGGLEVGALGVLALSLVCVLVAAEGL